MEEDYVILKQYLLNLEYNAPTRPEEFLTLEDDSEANQANELGLQIEFQESSGLYYVDLSFSCDATLPESIVVFTLKLIYRGIVVINFSLPEEKIRECLNILVPQELYEDIRELVYSITFHSGFNPIKLDDFSFKTKSVLSI
ncbi:MAG: protein-export chaperone SecB [Bacteroides sp.]|nr:protein-export chaperone SecB [Bacteroides sp.]